MRYDQHFMADEELAKSIVRYANIKNGERVLEIGSGKGILTKYLVKKSKTIAVEIDKNLCDYLKKLGLGNLEIINDSALNFDLDFDVVVSNLPYNICEPYINRLIKKQFKRAVFCVPVSFAKRFYKKRGVLSLVIPLFFKIKILEYVPRTAFSPPPKTDSAIISLEQRKYNTKKNNLIKEVYMQSDKKLKSAIQEAYCGMLKLSKRQAKEKIPKLSFLDKRVYMLNYSEWKELISRL